MARRPCPTIFTSGTHNSSAKKGKYIKCCDYSALVDKSDSAKTHLSGLSQNETDWTELPSLALLLIFKHLTLYERARAAQVCCSWQKIYHMPQLWQSFDFVIAHPQWSSLQPTPPALIHYILKHHAQHLRFVTFKVDSCRESAETACQILSQLVHCSLKTLQLMSSAKPSFLQLDPSQFVSALTLVIDKCHSLSSLAIEETPVDDPSLQLLATNSSNSLEFLEMKSCPRVSARGIQAVADHCHRLCELSLNYHLLNDDLLLALSTEEHAILKFLRVEISSEEDVQALSVHHIAPESWEGLINHSPAMALVMYVFVSQDDNLGEFFGSIIPVTHLYFGNHMPKVTLGKVAQNCPRLTELVINSNGNSLIDNEIVAVAKNCKKLSSLGLGISELSCSALVQLAKICGPRLKELYVMEESLVEDEHYDITHAAAEISRCIGQDWGPDVMPVW
ncbi:F-box/LRR-repeat protein 3-like isoform X2 [Limulus polyphemus]|nr:F-box/LRR-repeat protein 3-like isoform X2 [Limulus polyphemus]XP_013785748.1 F-box/LRR-repeat protein 3-like isoform X2 [Limulus polyphemus]